MPLTQQDVLSGDSSRSDDVKIVQSKQKVVDSCFRPRTLDCHFSLLLLPLAAWCTWVLFLSRLFPEETTSDSRGGAAVSATKTMGGGPEFVDGKLFAPRWGGPAADNRPDYRQLQVEVATNEHGFPASVPSIYCRDFGRTAARHGPPLSQSQQQPVPDDRTADHDDFAMFESGLEFAKQRMRFEVPPSVLIVSSSSLKDLRRTEDNLRTWFRDLPDDVAVLVPRGRDVGTAERLARDLLCVDGGSQGEHVGNDGHGGQRRQTSFVDPCPFDGPTFEELHPVFTLGDVLKFAEKSGVTVKDKTAIAELSSWSGRIGDARTSSGATPTTSPGGNVYFAKTGCSDLEESHESAGLSLMCRSVWAWLLGIELKVKWVAHVDDDVYVLGEKLKSMLRMAEEFAETRRFSGGEARGRGEDIQHVGAQESSTPQEAGRGEQALGQEPGFVAPKKQERVHQKTRKISTMEARRSPPRLHRGNLPGHGTSTGTTKGERQTGQPDDRLPPLVVGIPDCHKKMQHRGSGNSGSLPDAIPDAGSLPAAEKPSSPPGELDEVYGFCGGSGVFLSRNALQVILQAGGIEVPGSGNKFVNKNFSVSTSITQAREFFLDQTERLVWTIPGHWFDIAVGCLVRSLYWENKIDLVDLLAPETKAGLPIRTEGWPLEYTYPDLMLKEGRANASASFDNIEEFRFQQAKNATAGACLWHYMGSREKKLLFARLHDSSTVDGFARLHDSATVDG